jgi:protein phosphatase
VSHKSEPADTAELPMLRPSHLERPTTLSSRVRVDLAGLSDRGRTRPNNEDHYLLARFSRIMEPLGTNLGAAILAPFEETGYCLVVADGMGGMAAGEVASGLALTAGINLILNNPKWGLQTDEKTIREVLERARDRMRVIDTVLSEKARSEPALRGMGTTLTGAYSVGAELFLWHIGDSRAYLFRGGKLHRLTRDHTLAQALADCGQIPQEEVPTHRLRHVLTRALGGHGGDVEAEVQHLRLADGDSLLLCTDGLTEPVPAEQLADVLGRAGPAEAACRALIERALENGGSDNVTAVVARYAIPADA